MQAARGRRVPFVRSAACACLLAGCVTAPAPDGTATGSHVAPGSTLPSDADLDYVAGNDCPPVVEPNPRVVAELSTTGASLDVAFQYDALPSQNVALELELPSATSGTPSASVALPRGAEVRFSVPVWETPGNYVDLELAGTTTTYRVPIATRFVYTVDAPPRLQWVKLYRGLKALHLTWRGQTVQLYLHG